MRKYGNNGLSGTLLAFIAALALTLGFILAVGMAFAEETPVADAPPAVANPVALADDTGQSFEDSLGDMAPFEAWELLAGLIVSGLVVPIFQKPGYSDETRRLVALIVAAVVAIVGAGFQGELQNFAYTATGVVKMALVVYGAYRTVWKARFLHAVPERIEETTTR